MIFFTRIFALFSFGLLIQSAISMEEDKGKHHHIGHGISEGNLEHGQTPRLPFLVVTLDGEQQIGEFTQGLPVTGVVKLEQDGKWSMALGRTYARRTSLQETLHANGLEALWEVLARWERQDERYNTETHQTEPSSWQVLYLMRDGFVEGVGFILNGWSNREERVIPYIVTGDLEHAKSCIEHLPKTAHFVPIEVNEEQLKIVRRVASTYYPRFLCINGIKDCSPGHAGLSHVALGAALNEKDGSVLDNSSLYGFTILENGTRSGNTGSLTNFTSLKKHKEQFAQVESKLEVLYQ